MAAGRNRCIRSDNVPYVSSIPKGSAREAAEIQHNFVTGKRTPQSGPQIEIALRLQFGDAHHAALVGHDEARQQIGKADFLGFHGVATDGEFETGSGD